MMRTAVVVHGLSGVKTTAALLSPQDSNRGELFNSVDLTEVTTSDSPKNLLGYTNVEHITGRVGTDDPRPDPRTGRFGSKILTCRRGLGRFHFKAAGLGSGL